MLYRVPVQVCGFIAKKFFQEKNIFEIQSEIKNIGKFSGKQVIQIYAKKPQNEKFIKVQRELVAFAKTKELQPGESQILNLNVELDYLASYDDTGVTGNRACYVLEKGEYILYAGFSVANTRVDKSIIYRYTQKELKVAIKKIDKAASVGVATKNFSARNKSRLTKKVNAM